MPGEDFKRKLAAILHADVKGYSRLIGEDEEATVGTLRTYREAMGLVIRKHRRPGGAWLGGLPAG